MKTIVLIIAVLAGGATPILLSAITASGHTHLPMAQAVPQTQQPCNDGSTLATSAVSVAVSSGFMAWLCRYMIAVALPAKDKSIEEQQKVFLGELARERDGHALTVDKLVGEMQKEREARMEVIRGCPAREQR